MISGILDNNTPIVQINVAWNDAVQTPWVVLDTGFTGDLKVDYNLAQQLGLQESGVTQVRIASGKKISVYLAQAISDMEGEKNGVDVIVADGVPVVGISFLKKFGYKATVDCKYNKVELEKV